MRFPTWEKFPHFPVFVCWRRPLFFIVCISYKIKSCSYVAGEKKSWDDLHSWSTAELLGFGGERMWEEPTLKTTSHQQQPHTRFEKGTLKYSTPPVLRRGGDTRQLPTSILKATPFHTFDIVGAMTTPSLGWIAIHVVFEIALCTLVISSALLRWQRLSVSSERLLTSNISWEENSIAITRPHRVLATRFLKFGGISYSKNLLLGRVASSTYRPPFSNNSNIQKVEMWHFCNVNHPKQQANQINCEIDQIK